MPTPEEVMSAETSGEPAAVSYEGVGMTYSTARGQVHALAEITLAIPRGHFVSIVGPSGCGKSSLLMLTAGLRSRTNGQIHIDGTPINGPQANTGIVFQNDTLLDWRSALANVLLQVELRGLPKDRYRQKALDLLRSVGLGGFEDRHPYELSGGMRQRIAICRALIHDPHLLLMDEPFGALDALTRDQMMSDLQTLWLEQRKTVLFITHSIPEAIFLSDRVVVMTSRPGRIDDVVPIDLPRPRQLHMTTEPAFNSYVQRIREIFERQGVLRSDPQAGRTPTLADAHLQGWSPGGER
jgi:NitT/TauT family transport system ATP-binding protein